MRLFLACLLLGLLADAATAEFQPPPPFQAEYELNKGLLTLGRATLTFSRPRAGYYRYRLYTRPTGIASWFTDTKIRERSEGEITTDGFRPLHYTYERTGDDHARRAKLSFNWHNGTVENDVGEHPWHMNIPPGTIDRVVSPLQLMHDLAERERTTKALTYHIADGGKLKTYHLSIAGRETVNTPAGQFKAVRVLRRDPDGDRETRLWCAPELDYLAVKIKQWEHDDGTFTLLLRSIDGLPVK